MFRRIWTRPTLLAALDLTVTPCVPAAIEETIALGAQVQEEVLVVAVADADDKNGLDRQNNEHQLSLQHFLKNFCDRSYNRCFRIPWVAGASGLRKEIRYRCELGIKQAKGIQLGQGSG